MILEKTLELLLQIYKYHKILPPKVTRVVVGLGYTGVELAAYAYEPFLGLAQTLPSVIHHIDCSKTNFAGKLTELSFSELITWSLEPLSLEKTIGIATLNAASQHVLAIKNPYLELKKGLIDYLKINENTRINFIGFIGPMIKKVNAITKNITIVDDNPVAKTLSNEFNIKSNIDQLNEQELNVDILFCSGTSILNGTLEDIISIFKKNASYIVVIGPTISFIPDILFDYGVDIVGGMQILNSEATLKILQEGGGTRLFKKYGKKYNFIKS
ncbi:MAG: Rossmann-like domain-containing protein [Candidatus Hermodarchaeota archaeon]